LHQNLTQRGLRISVEPKQIMSLKQRLKQMAHSMQWRLVALFILLALTMTAAFIGGTQRSFASGWREAIRPVLGDYIDRLAAEIGSPPDINKAKALVARLPVSIRIQGPTLNYDSHPDKHSERYEHRRADRYIAETNTQSLLTRRAADGHMIRFGVGDLEWRKHPTGAALTTLIALLLLTGLAYFGVRKLLSPLADISAGAKRFGQGNFKQAIPVRRKDELGDLASQINTMAIDIDSMLEAKRGLLLAISHELRSPLTRARLNVELLPDNGGNLQSREALLRDFAVMNQLVSDLLESERLNDRHAVLNRQPTDVPTLVQDVVSQLVKGQTVKISIDAQIKTAPLDESRLRLLLRNLIDNAVQHGADAARVPEVIVSSNGKELNFTIRDYGSGVDENALSKLAQPFFRTDSARQRSTGGVGLGLYLCRLVAQAHGGRLAFKNRNPGLEVTATIPL
jgi:signal transduction histidine kinase